MAFDGRLHVADAVHRELLNQKHGTPKIESFFHLPRYWSPEGLLDRDELQTVLDLQRDWEAKHGLSYDARYNLGEAESIVVCLRRRNAAAGWTFVTNDHDATVSARLLKVHTVNPFSVVALFVHQGYLDPMEAWRGYQSMVHTHGMKGYLWLSAEPPGQKAFLERLSSVRANA
ncbi:MAG: hypothetical protein ABSD62_05885 [Candidatus Limnocylindrales bacterium]|jgi:hypothetical protein